MRSTSVITAQASSIGRFTVNSLTSCSAIGGDPPGCRCRSVSHRTVLQSPDRVEGASAIGHLRRPRPAAGPTRRGAAGPGGHACRRRWRRRSATSAAATARHASAVTNGWSPSPTTTAAAPSSPAASMPARSDVIWPSAQRSLTTWTTVGCSVGGQLAGGHDDDRADGGAEGGADRAVDDGCGRRARRRACGRARGSGSRPRRPARRRRPAEPWRPAVTVRARRDADASAQLRRVDRHDDR